MDADTRFVPLFLVAELIQFGTNFRFRKAPRSPLLSVPKMGLDFFSVRTFVFLFLFRLHSVLSIW